MRNIHHSALSLLALLSIPLCAFADMMPAPPLAVRVAKADAILQVKVIGFVDQDLQLPPVPNARSMENYRLAIIHVEDTIMGNRGIDKTTKIGFVVPPAPGSGQPIRSSYGPQLRLGQNAIVFLNPHHSKKFWTINGYYGVVGVPDNANKNENFQKQLKSLKDLVEIAKAPTEFLESKDPEKRLNAAALLIEQYRTPTAIRQKTEPVPAKVSALILSALAKADWKAPQTPDRVSPQQLFYRLGITKNDGFEIPARIQNPQEVPNAIQNWLRENQSSYLIRRFVP